MLKMFLRQCTLRLGRSAKFPRGDNRASSQGTMRQKPLILGKIMNIHEYANELICIIYYNLKSSP